MRGQVGDFRSALSDVTGNLHNEIPFDRKDVQLDIRELAAEAKDIRAIKARPGAATTSDTGGGASFGGGGGDSTSNLEAVIAALQNQNAGLRFGLNVQAAQLPILGSFRKGTIHLPADGLYYGHAGERITPANVSTSTGGGSDQPVNVQINVAPGMEWLKQFITLEIDGATHQIMENVGREADRRLRAGG